MPVGKMSHTADQFAESFPTHGMSFYPSCIYKPFNKISTSKSDIYKNNIKFYRHELYFLTRIFSANKIPIFFLIPIVHGLENVHNLFCLQQFIVVDKGQSNKSMIHCCYAKLILENFTGKESSMSTYNILFQTF